MYLTFAANICIQHFFSKRALVYGITDLFTFVIGTIFIILLPGPNSIFVLATATGRGIGAGYRAAAGVFVGDTILMVLAATGAASVLYANPALFTILKYAGAAYLAWIGITLLRQAWHSLTKPSVQLIQAIPMDGSPSGAKPARAHSQHQPFRRALLVSLLNPKAIFFFISFFVQFVDPTYPYPALTFFMLGVIVQLASMLYLTALIFGGSGLANRFRRHPRLNAFTAVTVGVVFIGFGLKLADATLR
jgi:leucine efflux protein